MPQFKGTVNAEVDYKVNADDSFQAASFIEDAFLDEYDRGSFDRFQVKDIEEVKIG